MADRTLIPYSPSIEVEYIAPPIPLRDFDYRANFASYEPGDCVGYGPTPEAEVRDLIDTWTNDGYSNASKRETESDLIEVQPERWDPIIPADVGFALLGWVFPTREEAMALYPNVVDAWKEPGEQA